MVTWFNVLDVSKSEHGNRVPTGEFRFFVAFVALCEEIKKTSWLTRRHKGTKKKDFCITGKDRWKKLNLRQSCPSFSVAPLGLVIVLL